MEEFNCIRLHSLTMAIVQAFGTFFETQDDVTGFVYDIALDTSQLVDRCDRFAGLFVNVEACFQLEGSDHRLCPTREI